MRTVCEFSVAVLLLATAARAESQELAAADYIEIEQLLARYVHAHDSKDGAAFAALFTEDGVFVNDNTAAHPSIPKGVMTWSGRKEIAGMMPPPRRERPKMTLFFSNLKIDASPEGARASHYVTMTDFQKMPSVTGGGFCENTLVKTREGWRFKKRVCYVEPGPASPPGQRSAR